MWIQRGFRGSETVRGFRKVSEGSETVGIHWEKPPKNLKKSSESIQTKIIPVFFGKFLADRLISKKSFWRDVAINFQKFSSKIIQ